MAKSECRYLEYAEGVRTGEIVVCRWVSLAVSRFFAWQERSDMEFRPARVERVITFVSLLKHFKNKHQGKPFRLEPWQEFIVACVFGFVWRDSGKRVCTSVYIEMSRKNGKTAFAAALSLYMLMGDGVAGAEVDIAANSREQANIAFDFASKFARAFNTKRKTHVRLYRNKILFDATDSKMHVFAADASKLDGFGASAYILDEYHEARDTKLREVLQSSQADREEPLEVIITTAGFNKDGPCYAHRSVCTEVLEGLVEDDAQWAFIYTLDDGDDWTKRTNWSKCAPNLGVTVQEDFMGIQVRKAQNDPSAEVGIRTKTFNQWMDSAEVWIPESYIIKAVHSESLEAHAGQKASAFVGIDLSSTSDLTAVAYLIEQGETMLGWVDYYLPEEALETKPLRETYKDWAHRGYLKLTPGNVVDYNRVLSDLLAYERMGLFFEAVAYDSWNATQFAINATEEGLNMLPFGQNIGNFNRPTRDLERRMLSGKILFANNPITRFCFRKVQLRTDWNGNVKPDKSKADNKIDGVIAILEALGGYLTIDH